MMFTTSTDWANARILLANDDGIHSPGLAILQQIAEAISNDVVVCAPETEQSATSHSLTIHRPLRLKKYAANRYSVDGTPTDCVLLAIANLLKDKPPQILLSGINIGENTGEDITYSGTIAAAMEATMLGVPAIAFSQRYNEDRQINWQIAERYGEKLLRQLLKSPWPYHTLLNVNFPDCDVSQVRGVKVARADMDRAHGGLVERLDPRGRSYYWVGRQSRGGKAALDSDWSYLGDRWITVTPLHLDLTHHEFLSKLSGQLSSLD